MLSELGELVEAIARQISYYNKQSIHTVDVKMVQDVQYVENVYNFIQQKNQQLSWNNQDSVTFFSLG